MSRNQVSMSRNKQNHMDKSQESMTVSCKSAIDQNKNYSVCDKFGPVLGSHIRGLNGDFATNFCPCGGGNVGT